MSFAYVVARTRVVVLALGGAAALAWGSSVLCSAPAEAADGTIGTVSFVEGEAKVARSGTGPESVLAQSAKLYQGDKVKTGSGARLEAKLNDGSMLRLGASSELKLDKVTIDRKNPAKKQVKAKLFVGRLWASVTKLFGSDSEFEVETPNAVAGVRGTKFNAATGTDGSTSVKVYSGAVLVSNRPIYAVKGHTKANRVQVSGPQEIGKKQWEELVAGAMQVVTVASNGEMSKPEAFAMGSAEDAEWEKWNGERDKLAGVKE